MKIEAYCDFKHKLSPFKEYILYTPYALESAVKNIKIRRDPIPVKLKDNIVGKVISARIVNEQGLEITIEVKESFKKQLTDKWEHVKKGCI